MATKSVCRKCGAQEDTRAGVCYGCATEAEAKGCAKRGHHKFGKSTEPGTPFWDRCMWCDHPRGLGAVTYTIVLKVSLWDRVRVAFGVPFVVRFDGALKSYTFGVGEPKRNKLLGDDHG